MPKPGSRLRSLGGAILPLGRWPSDVPPLGVRLLWHLFRELCGPGMRSGRVGAAGGRVSSYPTAAANAWKRSPGSGWVSFQVIAIGFSP